MKLLRPEEMLADTVCRCGHELGEHRATGKECMHGADEMGRGQTCQCEQFRADRRQPEWRWSRGP